MSSTDIKRCMQLFAKANPNPKTELNFSNTYQLLVAVVLSAQATDKSVNAATKDLFTKIKTPQQMLKLGHPKVLAAIKTIGLYQTKAKHVIALSQLLIEKHAGVVPADREALEALPGVGRKTANVVLNCAFGLPTMAVDTHIFRIGNRTGMAPGKTPREVEDKLLQVIPKHYLTHAHHWLILHGRYTCQARKPLCSKCLIAEQCTYLDKQI